MKFQRRQGALLVSLLLVGCGMSVQAPPTSGGGGGAPLVEAPLAPEAEAQFKMLDTDPARDVLARLAAELNINVVVNNNQTVIVNGVEEPTVTLPSNAEQVCHVPQQTSFDKPACASWDVTASSTRNDYFTVDNVRDTNLHSAWAPAENDEHPALTFRLSEPMDLSAMTLKMSPQGVIVDVDVMVGGQWQRLVTGLVPEYRTLDWINLPSTHAEQVRLSFRGANPTQALVCHVGFFGPGCGASASPTATPASTAPSASPSVMPSAEPSAETSAEPSVTPSASASPSTEPSASPSTEVSASPTATPSTEPAATPTPTPEATATPSVEPSTQPSGGALAPTT